jgi:hypothetical protein
MERITHSACKTPDDRFWIKKAPARHHDVFRIMQAHGFTAWGSEETGFWTNEQRYVDREEAWRIAEAAGQLNERAPTDGRGGTLYSEDVW